MANIRKEHTSPLPGESTLAWLLRHERDRLGHRFLQQEVADAAGVDKSTIRAYEQGDRRPNIEIAALLCDKLEITPKAMLLASLPPTPTGVGDKINPSRDLLEARRSRGFTREQMAQALDINVSLLRAYEEGLGVPPSIINEVTRLHYLPPGRHGSDPRSPQGVPTDTASEVSETRDRDVRHLRERIYDIDAPEGESPAQDGESDPRGES